MYSFSFKVVRTMLVASLVAIGVSTPHLAKAATAPVTCDSGMTRSVKLHLASYEKAHGGHAPSSKSARAALRKSVLTKTVVADCGGARNASSAYQTVLAQVEGQVATTAASATAVPATAAPVAVASAAPGGTVAECSQSVVQARNQTLLTVQETLHGTTFTFVKFNQVYQQTASKLPGCGTWSILNQTLGTTTVHQIETQDYQASIN